MPASTKDNVCKIRRTGRSTSRASAASQLWSSIVEKSSQARHRSGWRVRVRSIMSIDDGVTLWLRQLEGGDQDAARLLWQRYYRELVELARARLGQTPRRIADEEDVALSVLRC